MRQYSTLATQNCTRAVTSRVVTLKKRISVSLQLACFCSSERQNSACGNLITSRTSRLCLSVCLSNHHVSKERSTGMHISCLVECLLSNSAYISDLDFLFIYGLFNHALSRYDYCCDYFRVSVHGALCQLIHIHSRLGTQLCTVTAFRFLPRHSPGMKKKMKNLLITLPEIRKGPISP